MFTGIVEQVGTVVSLDSGVLQIRLDSAEDSDPIQLGESIAVNGVCLTVTRFSELVVQFDLSPETLARSSLGDVRPGSLVNLERAMKAGGRFGGHVVQGHVDATGSVVSINQSANSTIYRFRIPDGSQRYLIDKGSITIDGISLTVVDPAENEFDVWVIPHTIEHTNLKDRKPGDRVNLEFDVIAKYVERLIRAAK